MRCRPSVARSVASLPPSLPYVKGCPIAKSRTAGGPVHTYGRIGGVRPMGRNAVTSGNRNICVTAVTN